MPIVDLGSVSLHYRLEGAANGPVLALIHSLGTDLSMWDGVTDDLAADHLILRFDLRGHGASGVPPGLYQLADFCQDLFALLDVLNLARVHLAGTSLGGMIVMAAPSMLRAVYAVSFSPIRRRESVRAMAGAHGWSGFTWTG